MSIFLYILTFIFLIITIVGLINPKKILKTKDRTSRKRVLRIYGSIFLVLMLLVSINYYIQQKNATVNKYLRSAHEKVENSQFKEALEDYKTALDKWEDGKEYLLTKEEAEKNFEFILTNFIDSQFPARDPLTDPHLPCGFHTET